MMFSLRNESLKKFSSNLSFKTARSSEMEENLKSFCSRKLQEFFEVLSAFFNVCISVNAELLLSIAFLSFFIFSGVYGKAFCTLYLVYLYFDRNAYKTNIGGQGRHYAKSLIPWKYAISYLSMKLVKTVDLSPKRHYIFGVFPHGVLCASIFMQFVSTYSDFTKLFPGIRPRLATVTYHFLTPLYRELIYAWGMISVEKGPLVHALRQSNDASDPYNRKDGNTSNAIGIMVGGVEESEYAMPGVNKLNLKHKKGFIKLALETGTALVPVYIFNEVEMYRKPGPLMEMFFDYFKKYLGRTPSFLTGRFFWIPYRTATTTVVGIPIDVPKTEKPTKQEIDDLHKRFCDDLTTLFENNKHKYIDNYDKIHLEIA